MLKKGYSIVLAVILLGVILGIGIYYLVKKTGENGGQTPTPAYNYQTPTTPGTTGTSTQDLIRVTSPQPGALVKSPLTVVGQARGNWYFEASFPVRVLDATGKVLGVLPAQAQGEWMTTNFVPFSVTLPFATSTTDVGTLVLEKDNPSGLPENAAEVRIPIRFR